MNMLGNNPNSPFSSNRTFEEFNLNPNLLKGIYNMGFRTPSRIQGIVLPHLLPNRRRNIIAQSQSGTGKTEAFSIAIISQINPAIRSPQALIIVPTYELALQIGSVIEKLATFLPYIQIRYAVRDPAMSNRHNLVRRQLLTEPIVIGTPGTIEDWCYRLRVIDLKTLRICCLDEADDIIETRDFGQISFSILRVLRNFNCQIMLFSATYSDDHIRFLRTLIQHPVIVRINRQELILRNIRQFFVYCDIPHEKYATIKKIYSSITVGGTIIFCRTIAAANRLADWMTNQKYSVRVLTSDVNIQERKTIMQDFRKDKFGVLISANIATRGIDAKHVSLIINYDMPWFQNSEPDYETYLHRTGRCGRYGKQGFVFNLINTKYDYFLLRSIEHYFRHHIQEIDIDHISDLQEDQE